MKTLQKIFFIIILILALFIFVQNQVFAVDETYSSIVIGMNQGMNCNDNVEINLVLGEHETENLKVTVQDSKGETVENPNITWASSDNTTVAIDTNGTITAKKVGTAKITASGGGISQSRNVNVSQAPSFIDFSNATYTWERISSLSGTELKISNVSYKDLTDSNFYYALTENTTKPQLTIDTNGGISADKNKSIGLNSLSDYTIPTMDKYVELNKDIYIWIIQRTKFETYYNENGDFVSYHTKFIVEGKKLDKFQLPIYNGLFSATFVQNSDTQIIINAPCNTTRKFTIKIGKITDTNILNKIKNNEKDGFANLEFYAKSNSAIYEEKVTSKYSNEIAFKDAVLPLNGKLEDDAYYYLYLIFDDENGKYAPIEHCLTLAQANNNANDNWSLFFYGDDKFNWKDFSTEGTGGEYTPKETGGSATPTKKKDPNTTGKQDPTTTNNKLPYTGKNILIVLITLSLVVSSSIMYYKNRKYTGIK